MLSPRERNVGDLHLIWNFFEILSRRNFTSWDIYVIVDFVLHFGATFFAHHRFKLFPHDVIFRHILHNLCNTCQMRDQKKTLAERGNIIIHMFIPEYLFHAFSTLWCVFQIYFIQLGYSERNFAHSGTKPMNSSIHTVSSHSSASKPSH